MFSSCQIFQPSLVVRASLSLPCRPHTWSSYLHSQQYHNPGGDHHYTCSLVKQIILCVSSTQNQRPWANILLLCMFLSGHLQTESQHVTLHPYIPCRLNVILLYLFFCFSFVAVQCDLRHIWNMGFLRWSSFDIHKTNQSKRVKVLCQWVIQGNVTE